MEMYMDPQDAIKRDMEGHKLENQQMEHHNTKALYADIGPGTTSTIDGSNVMNMPIYSDPLQTQSSTPTHAPPLPPLPPPPSQTLPPPSPPPPGQQYASLNRIDNYKIADYQRRDQRRNQTYSSINHPPGIPRKSYSQLQFNRQKSDTTINGLQRLQYSTTVHQKPIFEV